MKCYQIQGDFSLDSLKLVDGSIEEPKAHQVVVKVKAVSLNYRDLLMITGLYNPKLKLPLIPCSDGAGEVIAVGSAVKKWKVGDRVAGTFFQGWSDGAPTDAACSTTLGGDLPGMLSEQVLLSEGGLVAIPEGASFQEAACLPCAALTAWNALTSDCALKPGGTVLTLGTGGVSIFAVQFAKIM